MSSNVSICQSQGPATMTSHCMRMSPQQFPSQLLFVSQPWIMGDISGQIWLQLYFVTDTSQGLWWVKSPWTICSVVQQTEKRLNLRPNSGLTPTQSTPVIYIYHIYLSLVSSLVSLLVRSSSTVVLNCAIHCITVVNNYRSH